MADNPNSQLPSIWRQRMTGLPLPLAMLVITSPRRSPSSVWRRRDGPAAPRLRFDTIHLLRFAAVVGRPVAHEDGYKVRELLVLAHAALGDPLHELLVAAAFLGDQPSPRALRGEEAGHDGAG